MAGAAGWLLVETLAGDPRTATVLRQDGKPKSWTAVSRALPSKAVVDAVHLMIAETMSTAERSDRSVRGDLDVLCLPVLGPSGAVHAVQVWWAPEGAEVPDPPFAGGFDWSSTTREFRYTQEIATFAGLDARSMTAPEAFDHIEGADDSLMSLILKLLQSNPGDRWDGPMTLRTPSNPLHIHRALRSLAEPDNTTWNGVLYLIAGEQPEKAVESAETLALRALSRASGTAVALLDAARFRIVRWMTNPIEGIAWKGIRDQRDTPHPDDIMRIAAAAQRISAGEREILLAGLRLRRLAGGWTVVDVRATVMPKRIGPKLLMVEFRTVGRSDEPDPVPESDTGYYVK